MTAPLQGTKVLDLTTPRGELAGRLLADLGAEVVKIEPPEGTAARRLPPFDRAGNSLFWACLGVGKRSVVIDLTTDTGRSALRELAAGCDILIESFAPGYLTGIGLGQEVLREAFPRLIYVSITPFGQSGPKAAWPATDLTLEAAGGRVAMQGDTDRPPLPIGVPQASFHAGAQAAADALVALNERRVSGEGQFLDLSMQEAMWWTMMATQGYPVCTGRDPTVASDRRTQPPPGRGALLPSMAECADGLVVLGIAGSPPGKKNMVEFAIDEARDRGEDFDEAFLAADWRNWLALVRERLLSDEDIVRAMDCLRSFIRRRTKTELVAWALANDLRLGPVNTTRDLVTEAQFEERGFFRDIGGVRQPGPWVRLHGTPLRLDRSAPQLGADRVEWSPTSTARAPSLTSRSGNAFEGLKVADFSWVAAGPTIGKALGDHGATVVKIESGRRLDLSRTLPPHIDGVNGVNRSYWSYLYATSKLSLACDLSAADGRAMARRLVDWADVVIESFSPGTMAKMGLDYDTVTADRDDLIMLSTSMLGQTGPLREYAGYGQQAAAFCGLQNLTGWPDRDPCGVHGPYTDVIAPKFGIAALAAAIHARAETGKGQFIDLAQAECSMYFLAPAILDETVNGRTAAAPGLYSPHACPHGVYATRGTERYLALAVTTAEEWGGLTELAPLDKFAGAELDDLGARQNRRDSIDAALAAWLRTQDGFEAEVALAEAGVPASVVLRPTDFYRDRQIEARGFKQSLAHSECGDVVHYGFCTRFSAKEQMVRTAPPCLGEHTDYVLGELLRLSSDEIHRLRAAGVLE